MLFKSEGDGYRLWDTSFRVIRDGSPDAKTLGIFCSTVNDFTPIVKQALHLLLTTDKSG
jgi:hypothetical protein